MQASVGDLRDALEKGTGTLDEQRKRRRLAWQELQSAAQNELPKKKREKRERKTDKKRDKRDKKRKQKEQKHTTKLIKAVRVGKCADVARYISKSYSPDAVGDDGLSALQNAAAFEQRSCSDHWQDSEECSCGITMMKLLLDAGAAVCWQDRTSSHNSALHHLCISFAMGLMSLDSAAARAAYLLSHGAQPHALNASRQSCHDLGLQRLVKHANGALALKEADRLKQQTVVQREWEQRYTHEQNKQHESALPLRLGAAPVMKLLKDLQGPAAAGGGGQEGGQEEGGVFAGLEQRREGQHSSWLQSMGIAHHDPYKGVRCGDGAGGPPKSLDVAEQMLQQQMPTSRAAAGAAAAGAGGAAGGAAVGEWRAQWERQASKWEQLQQDMQEAEVALEEANQGTSGLQARSLPPAEEGDYEDEDVHSIAAQGGDIAGKGGVDGAAIFFIDTAAASSTSSSSSSTPSAKRR
jgi:hypothetical protein